MDKIKIERTWLQGSPVQVDNLMGNAFVGEAGAHEFLISGKDNAGNVVPITGTITGKFLSSTMTTFALSGYVTEGVASVTLPSECYGAPGQFVVSIFATNGSTTTCIYCGVGSIFRTSTAAIAYPTTTLPDLTLLINQLDDVIASFPADLTHLLGAIAPTFVDNQPFTAGQYVWYNQVLYRFTADHPAGSWAGSADTVVAVVGTELNSTVRYTQQVLTDAQKTVARTNIDAADADDVTDLELTTVQVTPQTFDDNSKSQARSNIGAASSGDLSTLSDLVSQQGGYISDLSATVGTVPTGETVEGQIGDLKSAIDDLARPPITWIDGQYVKSDGSIGNNSSYHRTGLIDVGSVGNNFVYKQIAIDSLGVNIYDGNQNRITTLPLTDSETPVSVEGVIDLSEYPNARYIEFGEQKTNGIFDLQLTQEYKKTFTAPDGSITRAKLDNDLKTKTDSVGELKSNLDDLARPTITWIDGQYIKSDGDIANNSVYHRTGPIDVGNTGNIFKYTQLAYNNLGINIYDKNQSRITTLAPTTSTTVIPVTGFLNLADYPNARYIEFGEQKVNGIFNLQVAQEYKKMLSIPDNMITTAMMQDESVTLPKVAFAVHDPGTNFIDKTRVTSGKIINQSGAVANASGWCCTDYIELTPGTKYYISDYIYRKYWGFYNASKEVVGCYNDDGDLVYSFTFPSGAKYARFSFQTTEEYFNGAYVSINSGKPSDYGYKLNVETETPTDYEGMDVSTFNKLLCIGDSLTYGYFNRNSGATADYVAMAAKYSYPTQFKKITGVDTTNKGDSGKTTAEWYSLHGNEDLSGHDACIIELGTNDGTWTSASETAMSNIIAKVKADNKGIKIFVSTIPNGQSYVTSAYKAINAGIRAYVAGLNDADVYFIDLEAYGHMIQSAGYNAGHLSAYGYWRLAKDYANYISYIMNKNKNAFRLVQFTGTDDTYTP